jgi:probable FeS assembly SUF system protein SufT
MSAMMTPREEITLTREVAAVLIPSGDPTTLPGGLKVRITQSLGGTYTVMTENGLLARIEATDGDALGKEPTLRTVPSVDPTEFHEELVWDQLRTCYDPEIPVNIVDLGLVYAVEVGDLPEGGKRVDVKMTLTAPGCGMGNVLKVDIERKLSRLPGVRQAEVDVVLDPPWSPALMSEAARLELGIF